MSNVNLLAIRTDIVTLQTRNISNGGVKHHNPNPR